MKIKEVIARAVSGAINWIQAAEILGMSDRQLLRLRKRWDQPGYDGFYDRRARRPGPKRGPMADMEKVGGCTGNHVEGSLHQWIRGWMPIPI